MQSQEFVALLGDAFTYEKGYPSLKTTSFAALHKRGLRLINRGLVFIKAKARCDAAFT